MQLDLVIVTAFYKRHALSALWLEHTSTLDVPIVAVVDHDDERHAELCRRHGVTVVRHQGQPLSDKFNAGTCYAHQMHPDKGVMILGSDDLCSFGHVAQCSKRLRRFDVVVPGNIAILDVRNRRAVVLEQDGRDSRLFGAGRAISAKVMRETSGVLWSSGRGRGLDSDSFRRLRKAGHEPYVMTTHLHGVVDVKAGTNMWPYDRFKDRGTPCTVSHAMWMVDPTLRERILAL